MSASSSSFDQIQQNAGEVVVAAYRKLAALEGCAPTAKTSDAKILEIYTKTLKAFRDVARQRGERLPAEKVNAIVLKFLTCYEMLGETFINSHLVYETDKYRREGLREDYRRKLDFLAIMLHEPKGGAAGADHPPPIEPGKTNPVSPQQPEAPRFTIPLPAERRAAEAAATARKMVRTRWLWSGIGVMTLCLIGIGLVWGFGQRIQTWKSALSLESPLPPVQKVEGRTQSVPSGPSVEKLYARAFDLYQSAQGESDYVEAASFFEQAAQKGHRPSMERLAWMYADGIGVTGDWEQALGFFLKATENESNGKKKKMLNVFLEKFREIEPESYAIIHEWLARIAATGDTVFALALNEHENSFYGQGQRFVEAYELRNNGNYTEAFRVFHGLADMNDEWSQFYLGLMYEDGQGVAKNEPEAAKWYRQAAEQGHSLAQNQLGWMYEYGRGVVKNDAEAVKWYRRAAEQGHEFAQYCLGGMYAYGHGVAKNGTEALKWYRQAAEQGFAEAQLALGNMYSDGRGVAKNAAKAVIWYRQAAEQGNASAQFNLGLMYANGRGVAKNAGEAVKWYRMAAEQGEASAQWNMGAMYAKGQGVPINDTLAYKWTALAMASGENGAKNNLTVIARRMTSQQIAEGQRLAAAFVPKGKVNAEDGGAGRSQSVMEQEGLVQPRRTAPRAEAVVSTGTGFFIDKAGHILTAHHVIRDAQRIRIRLSNGSLIPARVIRTDTANDVALLRADYQSSRWLACADSNNVSLGQSVFTIGFPNSDIQGVAPKYNDGKISSLSGLRDDKRHLQTSIPATNGNSGGPLLDSQGRVIGLIVEKLNDLEMLKRSGNTGQSVSYALKTSYLAGLLHANISTISSSSFHSPPQFDPAVIDHVSLSVVLVVAE